MTRAAGLGRLCRTVRYLTPRQIAARLSMAARFRLYAHLPQAARVGLGGRAEMEATGLEAIARWLTTKFPGALSARRVRLAADAAERRFTFLNRTRGFHDAGPDWRPSDMSRLWQYHRHYADYVAALGLGAQRGGDARWADHVLALIDHWIRANPAGGRPGWANWDGIEQSEVWASHRVGRRARPLGARLTRTDGGVVFAGAHDGYARLGVIHHRHVIAVGDVWIVVDELRGHGRHRFESYLHLHPALEVRPDGGDWCVAAGTCHLRVRPFGPMLGARETGWYCPDWGVVSRSPVLTFRGAMDGAVAFGYALAPVGLDVTVTAAADASGLTLTGRIGGRPLGLRSERCTSSS